MTGVYKDMTIPNIPESSARSSMGIAYELEVEASVGSNTMDAMNWSVRVRNDARTARSPSLFFRISKPLNNLRMLGLRLDLCRPGAR